MKLHSRSVVRLTSPDSNAPQNQPLWEIDYRDERFIVVYDSTYTQLNGNEQTIFITGVQFLHTFDPSKQCNGMYLLA